ncbi:zinc finger and BTB domain-containing protein 49-like [Maniola jurtina]|uniref:zinc finger and BTB domain-containing protein 49-like n=1 Tax=Maniola jurtina TaxID=191418 RepID=UPI001E68BBAE|nr:zinc finger and BTB domain-containing protein 49-like [Maniola jurtina]
MNTKRVPMDVDEEIKSESCRICLTPNNKMINIFARTLLTKIEYCTGIKICQNFLESNIKTEQTHDTSKIVDKESDEDFFNDGWLKRDQSNNNFNGECFKKDHSNDKFNESSDKGDHSSDNFDEEYLDEDYLKENLIGDQINDADNVINDGSDQNNGITIVKEEIKCEYEESTEDVPKEILQSLEGKSSIDRPRRTPKPSYYTVSNLRDHVRIVHERVLRYACHICGKMFYDRTHLRRHVDSHSDIKRYYTVSNLRDHVRIVHERVLRHACHICGKMFYDRTHLRRHVDSHSDIKRFECEVCHSAFTRRCHWKKHLLKQHSIAIPAQRPGRVRVGATGDSLAPDAADAARHLRSNYV